MITLDRRFRYCLKLCLGSIIVGLWFSHLFGHIDLSADRTTNMFAVIAQIAATMMGFLLAALAILASIAGMRLLRNLQRTGHFSVLLSRLFIAAACSFFLMISAGAAMLLGDRMGFAMELLFTLIVASCASLIDASMKLTAVLMALKPSGTKLES